MALRGSLATVWVVGLLIAGLVPAAPASADTITLGTYNIENWSTNFEGFHLSAATRRATTRSATGPTTQPLDPRLNEMIQQERFQNDEDHWEVARVILDPNFNPDILVVQEGTNQRDLEYFNKRWLNEAYDTVIQFPSNSDRDQHLNVLVKPGFKVLERRDQYYKEPDTAAGGNDRGDRLFARGPAFVLIESPTGYRFWVGTTHQKSKNGNSVEVTQWRNREAKRTHEIMKELAAEGPDDVILLGDMNDAPGVQEFEAEGGGDTIANLLGPKEAGFVLATEKLAAKGMISFGGYWRTAHRELIDHAVLSPGMKDQLADVKVMITDIGSVASDHYPLMVKIHATPPATTQPAPAALPALPVPTSDDPD